MTGLHLVHSAAQDRADDIKATRLAERTEDVFDTRRTPLTVVPPIACAHRVDGWVCVSRQHPANPHHYFVKEGRA